MVREPDTPTVQGHTDQGAVRVTEANAGSSQRMAWKVGYPGAFWPALS